MTLQDREKKHRSKYRTLMLLICSVIVSFAWVGSLRAEPKASAGNSGLQQRHIWTQPGKTISLAIYDASAAVPLKNSDVRIFCEGPISEAVMPPREAKGAASSSTGGAQSWQGRTDDAGVLSIPRSALPGDCRVEAPSFVSTYIHDACLQPLGSGAGSGWQIDLFQERLDKEGEFGSLGLKLLDGATGKPLVDVPVRIDFLVGGALRATANARGFVFFGREKTFGRNAWIVAPGYRRKVLDFDSGPLLDVCGTKLDRQ